MPLLYDTKIISLMNGIMEWNLPYSAKISSRSLYLKDTFNRCFIFSDISDKDANTNALNCAWKWLEMNGWFEINGFKCSKCSANILLAKYNIFHIGHLSLHSKMEPTKHKSDLKQNWIIQKEGQLIGLQNK